MIQRWTRRCWRSRRANNGELLRALILILMSTRAMGVMAAGQGAGAREIGLFLQALENHQAGKSS